MDLTPEDRRRIYEEEKARIEAERLQVYRSEAGPSPLPPGPPQGYPAVTGSPGGRVRPRKLSAVLAVELAVTLLVVIAIAGIVANVSKSNQGNFEGGVTIPLISTPRPLPPPTARAVPGPGTVNAPAVTFSGDGVKIVGKEIKPGTYRTRTREPGCYWARVAGFSGELGDILANGNEAGPVIVTIKPGDGGFECHGCGFWTQDLSAITTAPDAPFPDGVFIVNTDIAPGTWRADSPETCYWARLRGFTGGMGDVISNGLDKGLVTIARTDKGFKSSSCGTWTKVK